MSHQVPEVAAAGAVSDELTDWLKQGLRSTASASWLRHDGLRLRVREWGSPGLPGIVLVHGGAAHSHWWDHIAPRLADRHRVIAMDLSGHGDSDWRPDGYGLAQWAREALAVADLLTSDAGHPILIGHSLGGLVALRAALEPDVQLGGVVALDARPRQIGTAEAARRQRRAERVDVAFPSLRAAVERFQTLPSDGRRRHIPALVRHVAETSVRQVADGWAWKVDRQVFLRDALDIDDLRELGFPTLVVAAEDGLLSQERAAAIAQRLGRLSRHLAIPQAGHHLMLDQPMALVACLRSTVAAWR